MSFNFRSKETEIMDDLLFDASPVMEQTLKELKLINKWLGGNQVTIDALEKIINKKEIRSKQPIKVADLGCGGGDMLVLLANWFRNKSIKTQLTGIDANPNIISYARKNTKNYSEIIYKNINIFSEEFTKENYDIANCTLFCHHFSDDQLIQLLKSLKNQISTAVIINDLHRHWFAYHSIALLTAYFSRSYMVKNDAKLSVLRSFRKPELETIIKESGFSTYEIRWKWAFRYQVILYP
ncbi:MAG TPA: methyltransferase domain-containing protein [Cytophagaceae bacterium]